MNADQPQTKTPPPSDVAAEASVLGAILYDARHVGSLPSELRPESFFSEAHRQIFAVVDELRTDRVDVSLPVVEARMRAKGRLPQLPDGAAYLPKLVDETPVLTPATFATLARVVLDKASARSASLAMQKAIARLHGTEPVGSVLADVEREMQRLALTSMTAGLVPMHVAFQRARERWKAHRNGNGQIGLRTGFSKFDTTTSGLHEGDLVIVAARPGMGKTAFATACAVSCARAGHEAAIFSLEMPADQLAERMACTEAGLSLLSTRSRALKPEEFARGDQAIDEMSRLGLFIDDASKGRPAVADIVTRARRQAAESARRGKRLRLVLVDYIQIVKLNPKLQAQRHDIAIGEVTTELKSLAKELKLTVLALAQLSRGVESRTDKRPMMSDLKDSGQLEQDADLIAMLYRDDYYHRGNSKAPGEAELIIEKSRSGPTGTINLAFHGPTTRFSDLSTDPDRPTDDGEAFAGFTRGPEEE